VELASSDLSESSSYHEPGGPAKHRNPVDTFKRSLSVALEDEFFEFCIRGSSTKETGPGIGSLADRLLETAGFISGAIARCRYQFPALNEQRLFRVDPHTVRHPLTLQG
jgi:hypothetical protein